MEICYHLLPRATCRCRDFGADNSLVRWQSSRLSPRSDPCLSCDNHPRRLLQKKIEGFDCNINDRALGGAFWHSLGGSNGPAQSSTNTERFGLGGSRYVQRQARLMKRLGGSDGPAQSSTNTERFGLGGSRYVQRQARKKCCNSAILT